MVRAGSRAHGEVRLMKRSEVIDKWYTLALGGEIDRGDIFFRFMALWVAFNALYGSRHSYRRNERDQIEAYCQEQDVRSRHLQLLHSDHEYTGAVNTLKKAGVYSYRDREWRHIHELGDLRQVARCFYQVRNNLFHGNKAGDLRDEELVAASYTIVSKLIEPHLDAR
jgi:hypothetical protein